MKLSVIGRALDNGVYRTRPQGGEILDVVVLNGIGDFIYTWYKIDRLVKEGYRFRVYTSDGQPQRAHQLADCLDGVVSFNYLSGLEFRDFWMKNVHDIKNPPINAMFHGKPVLHVNSFLEEGFHLDEFMPDFPCNYDIGLYTSEESKREICEMITPGQFNMVLYCSSYRNNMNCNMFPDPNFWSNLAKSVHAVVCPDKPLHVRVAGASYDSDLTVGVHESIKNMGIETSLFLDHSFDRVIDMVRYSDMVVTYESGFAMVADTLKVPCVEFFRQQGNGRDDKAFPWLGPINPDGIGKRFFPFFYDDDIATVQRMLSDVRLEGG